MEQAPHTPARRDAATIMTDIVRAYSALSPENLWMDGEASEAEASRRYRSANAALQSLFREFGRTVTEEEAWAWYAARRSRSDRVFVR
jgi:hypothetical protein